MGFTLRVLSHRFQYQFCSFCLMQILALKLVREEIDVEETIERRLLTVVDRQHRVSISLHI